MISDDKITNLAESRKEYEKLMKTVRQTLKEMTKKTVKNIDFAAMEDAQEREDSAKDLF